MSNVFNNKNKIIMAIIAIAFLIRLFGINYGLPLWLIGDEPPLTTATLKMIELKTIIPALHQEAFKPTLYFPPYLSHIYLLPFTFLLGIKYMVFNGTILAFKNYIVSDLSHFFLLARFISIIFGTLTVWLVYKISKNIFKEEKPAILSAIFLSFSTLHVYLSFVARDWIVAVFLFALGIWCVTNPSFSPKKRYVLGAITSGFAFGVSLIAGFLMIFMLYWYLLYEKHSPLKALKEKFLYSSLFIFLFLSATSIATYPFGFHLSGDNSIKKAKSLSAFAISVAGFLKPILISEPVLIVFAFVGLAFAYKKMRGVFWTMTTFFLTYASIFYWVFHYKQRFTIYLFPLIALLAGYGLYMSIKLTPNKIIQGALIALLLIPLVTSLRLDWLAVKNDSRIQAREWVKNNLPKNTKIMVYAEMTRFPTTRKSIQEQQKLDPKSLRKIDDAELSFNNDESKENKFHALNLYAVNNNGFFENIVDYAKKNGYEYFVVDPVYPPNDHGRKSGQLRQLSQEGEIIKSFGETQMVYDFRDGNFGDPVGFFQLKSLGPKIEIYKLKYE